MLRVGVLGELTLSDESGVLPVPAARRARELLAWLALHPGLHARAQVAARFWPDVLDTSARTSLRTALHELRRGLGPVHADVLISARDQVGLARDVWVDAVEFERLLGAGRLEAALELCRGDPLPELDEEWVVAFRDEHRGAVDGLLERLVATARERGEEAAALGWCRERVRRDPLSEVAARALMTGLAEAGEVPAAIAVYKTLESRLRDRVGVPPSRETRLLVAELRSAAGEVVVGPVGLPSVLSRREASAFVGRRRGIERLSAALRAAGSNERRLGLVIGEPGIGKSRLLAELCLRAHRDGWTILLGRCREEQIVPYEPFAEALGWYVREVGSERLPGGVDRRELGRLVPGLEVKPERGGGDVDSARWLLFEAVGGLLERIACSAPVFVAIDDLHWAERSTLLMLSHLVRRSASGPVAFVGTYRDSELGAGHPLRAMVADLSQEGLLERVSLGGLDRGEVETLVSSLIGAPAPGGLCDGLLEETGGNPFFIGEVVRHLVDSGAIQDPDSRLAVGPSGGLGVPQGLREAIGRRLERLSDAAQRTLAAASVAGRSFEISVLERLSVLEGLNVLDALEEAQARAMVREDADFPGRYGFAHPLIRDVLYSALGVTRRARLHAATAAALQSGRRVGESDLPRVAHHLLEAAAVGDPLAAVEHARSAAAAAVRSLAFDEAAVLLRRALDVVRTVGDPRLECETCLELGDALLRTIDAAAAGDQFERAAALAGTVGDGRLLARAALGCCGLGVAIMAVDARAVALLEQALERPDVPDSLRAALTGRLAVATYYGRTPLERKRLGDEALALAERAGEDRAVIEALNARHAALWSPAYLQERLDDARQMITLAERLGDDERVLEARAWLICDLAEGGDLLMMRDEVALHEELAAAVGVPAYLWWAPMWRSSLACLEGEFEESQRLRGEVEAIARQSRNANARIYVDVLHEVLAFNRERWEECDLDVYASRIPGPAEPAWRTALAWVLAGSGEEAAAREQIAWLTAGGLRVPDDMNRVASLCELTQALVLVGEARPASEVYDALAPYRTRAVVNARGAVSYGAVAHHLGQLAVLLGRGAEAAEHLQLAIEQHERWGARGWLARSQLAYAQLLAARQDPDRAAALAAEAAETAHELGLRDTARAAFVLRGALV